MLVLYFISDVILAIIFEPLMLLFLRHSAKSPKFARVRMAMAKSVERYGINPGPFSLVMITFGTDPMTGRSVAKAAGHGFFSGWAISILGDMLFFTLLMASTLWLNNIIGDGTVTAVIIMVAMMLLPPLARKLRMFLHNLFS
jgi:hypothetical protein